MNKPLLCVVEDDLIMGESLCDRFVIEGFEVDWFKTAEEASSNITPGRYSLVISDIRLPDKDGEDLFREAISAYRNLPPFVFITGFGAIDKAVALLQLGAADYITKPFDIDVLVDKAKALVQGNPLFESKAEDATLGISAAMRNIEATLPRLAEHASTVLITGESGVGKEYVARRLHDLGSEGQKRPFVAVNCGAINESLLEAELFGHEKGAFTGAIRNKKGVFERADKGTLLLDEIGDMPLSMQVTLLRVLQDGKVVRVGGEQEIPVDVHVVCATNKDLRKMVDLAQFREDLYYRINVVHIHVPPLRERREDILWFAKKYVLDHNQSHPDSSKVLDRRSEQALLAHSWPGNLRELNFCIERSCIMDAGDSLSLSALFPDCEPPPDESGQSSYPSDATLREHLQEREREFIFQVLADNAWHIKNSADALGISRKNLWEKMRKLNIQHSVEDT